MTKESFQRRMAARVVGLIVAWCIVLTTLCSLPAEVSMPLSSTPYHISNGQFVLGQLIVSLWEFWALIHFTSLPVPLLAASDFLCILAYGFFSLTFLMIFVPPWSLFGKALRYQSLIMLSVWIYPLLNYFYSIGSGATELEYGFYVMAGGMTLGMCSFLYAPRRPEEGPAFPVVKGGIGGPEGRG